MHPSHAVLGLCLALLLALPVTSQPQDDPVEVAFVVNEAQGTVYLPPSHIAFWIHATLPVGDLKTALPAAETRERDLRTALADAELRPASLESYAPRIDSFHDSKASWSARIHFPMAGLVGGELGATKLGAFCETLKKVVQSADCTLSEPDFVVLETRVPIQEAVREATNQAFVAAEGAAAALNTQIRSVHEVQIKSITWNTPPDTEATFPDINTIACTAAVKVTYTVY